MNYNKIRKNCTAYRFDLGYNWTDFLNEPKNDYDKIVCGALVCREGINDLVLYVIYYTIEGGKGRAEILIGESDSSIQHVGTIQANKGNVDNMEFVNRLIEENINDWIFKWFCNHGDNINDCYHYYC